MAHRTEHYIKIYKWIKGRVELEIIDRVFGSLIDALIFAREYSGKSHHCRHHLKVYNHLGECVHSHEEDESCHNSYA